VFPTHPEIMYLGRRWKKESIHQFFLENQYTHPLQYDAGALRRKFYADLNDLFFNDIEKKKVLMVSHESLHSGPEWFGAEVVMMAERIKSLFPSAKIIIGIRNQLDYIESNYKSYIIHGGRLSYRNFIYHSYAFNYALKPKLEYDKVITRYKDLFGAANVCVYLLEGFKSDLRGEINRIWNFMRVSPLDSLSADKKNVGLSKTSIGFIRLLNKMIAYDFNEQYYHWMKSDVSKMERFRWNTVGLLKKIEAKKFFPLRNKLSDDKTSEHIKNQFRESNVILSAMLNREIKSLGYS